MVLFQNVDNGLCSRRRLLRLIQHIGDHSPSNGALSQTPVASSLSGSSQGGLVDMWRGPRFIYWGKPASTVLPKAMKKLRCQRAFLMVSSTLRKTSSAIEDIMHALGTQCVGVWDGMPAHTPRESVIEVAIAARNANADVIVTIGGGSLTDGAKAARIAIAVGANDTAALGAYHSKLNNTPLAVKQISIPTTLSAGEYSAWTGVTDSVRRFKDPYLFSDGVPAAVVLDPDLSMQSPPHLILSTGIRAVDHCVEAMCSLEGNPYSDGVCADALAMLVSGLRGVRVDPHDRDAHIRCQIGTWKSVQGISAGPKAGASHAIGHVMGGAFNVPHGETSCVALPAVIEWNSRSHSDVILNRQANVVRAFQNASAADSQPQPSSGTTEYRSLAARLVAEFIEDLGLPRSLGEVKITTPEQLEELAKKTMEDPLVHSNPRHIAGWTDVAEILQLMV